MTAPDPAERRVERLTQLYLAQSLINEAVVHASEFRQLCDTICHIAVEQGGIACALIRLHEPATDLLLPAAFHGPDPELIGRQALPASSHTGISAMAFSTGKPVVVHDMQANPVTRDAAMTGAPQRGINSAAAFPLFGKERIIGTFALFAMGSGFFDEEMTGLLEKTASILGFAHTKIEAVAALATRERDLALAQEAGHIGSVIVDLKAGTWSMSPVGCSVVGIDGPRFRPIAAFEALQAPPGREQAVAKVQANVGSAGRSDSIYQIVRPVDGTIRWIRVIANTEYGSDGTAQRRIGTVQDVTEQQLAEQSVRRLTRLYAALSKTNEAIAHAQDFVQLCAAVCRIIVTEAGVVLALIRLHDPATGTLRLVAEHGPRRGLIGRTVVSTDDTIGLAPKAFRQARHFVVGDIASDTSALAVAASDAAVLGISAAASFPLLAEGVPVGTLTIFAQDAAAFDAQMAELFDEIANAVGFARAKIESEAARRETDERMAAIVGSAMNAIITCDEDLRILVFNQAAAAMFGCAAGDALGASIEQFLPERFRAGHARWMRGFADGQATTRAMGAPGRISALRADGSEFPAEASISHTEVAGRRIYSVILRDITASLAAQRALAEAERRYRSLVETSLNGVMLLSADVIEYANPGAAAMLGFTDPAEACGISIYSLLDTRFHAPVDAQIRRLMSSAGQLMERQNLKVRRRDGRVIDVLATAASIDAEGRQLIQLEIHDVTRERRALADAKEMNETLETRVDERTAELTAANRNLESFSYSVAHDLRAPLRSMIGFANLLRIDLARGEQGDLAAYVERICGSATQMNALIDGLLAVARVTHGALGDDPVRFGPLLREVLRETNPQQAARIDVGPLPAMRGDATALRQVWINLVSNAIKYSAKKPQPQVSIGYEPGDTELVFHVRDNGAGFDAAHAGKLFGVFQRLHAARDFEGTGVGLAIVRRIVERHGGRVWAEGAPDAGATFYFTLPAARFAEAAPAEPSFT